MAIWTRITGAIAGIGVGGAAAAAMEPILEVPRQKAWRGEPNRILDLGTLAHLIATGLLSEDAAVDEAKRNGYDENRLRARIQLALTVPGIAELDDMLNRRTINRAQFNHALAKHGIEKQYWDAIYDLLSEKLSPATVANAVQQGHMPNVGESGVPILPPPIDEKPGLYPQSAEGPDYNIPLTTIPLDPELEAEAQGLDLKRLQIEANLSGLPPPQEMLLDMWRRGIITKEAVIAGIREGHTKTKWIPAVLAMKRRRLAAQEYANAWLREWVTEDEAVEGARQTGINKEDLRLLYLNRGRPAAPGQMWTAWARKVIGPRGVPTDYTDHEQAIRRSNIRPEYAEMLWGIRFNYPPLFQLNRLVQAGAVDVDTAAEWAHKSRVAPEVIEALKKYWSASPTAKGDPHVTKAQTQLWGTLHSSFLAGETDDTTANKYFEGLGIFGEARTTILAYWHSERELIRKQLTAAQVKKAWRKAEANPATGAPWTRDEATTRLIALGYNLNDATSFLDL